jgi:hypothetical protein
MKIRINTKILESLNPCKDRLDNWKTHYSEFNGDITKFLLLDKISHLDKIWVCMKLVPMEVLAIFAIDCSFSAASYIDYAVAVSAAADAYVAYADAYAATYTYTAVADAAYIVASVVSKQEQARQIEALIYLVKGEK